MALLHVEVQGREVAKVEEKEEKGEKEEEKEEKTCAAVPGGILQAALLAAAGATQFNALQPTATQCNALHRKLRHTTRHCSILQLNATFCNALQHTTPHCSTPQHTATHRNNAHVP